MFISALISSLVMAILFYFLTLAIGDNITILSFLMFFIVALTMTSVIGIPITKILKLYRKLNWWTICFAGFTMWFLLNFILSWIMDAEREYTYHNYQIIEGAIPIDGWITIIQESFIVGIAGIIANAIFYKVLTIKEKDSLDSLNKMD